ncbi:MAG: toll/interleukin-1 receptor domain-containing protein [Candidatus Competibacter sp.]|nr:toll/interleukin-1 receptor domain-containing protein [Candidatus Competibacter sp.]
MTSVFISYRRQDTRADAGRLHDHFVEKWGRDKVFIDIDSIPGGSDFARHIQETLSKRPVVIILIGNNWLSTINESGKRRLDDPYDFVRMEVALALSKGLKVIPVLVAGARMPSSNELPEDIKRLSELNAREISDRHFSQDLDRLMRDIGDHRSHPYQIYLTGFLVAFVAVGMWLWFHYSLNNQPVPLSNPKVDQSSTTPSFESEGNVQPTIDPQVAASDGGSHTIRLKSELLQWLIVSNPVLSPRDVLDVKVGALSSKVRAVGKFLEANGTYIRKDATYSKDAGGAHILYRIPNDTQVGHHKAEIYVQEIGSGKNEIHSIEYEIVSSSNK